MDQNQDIIARLAALEKWKAEKERQQIKLPLDAVSIAVLQEYFMRITAEIITTSATGNSFITFLGEQTRGGTLGGGVIRFQVAENNLVPYTVVPSTNIFTVTRGRFADDEEVVVATSDTAPSPLVVGVSYFIRDAASNGQTFKLTDAIGNPAIDITDDGTGYQYISYI